MVDIKHLVILNKWKDFFVGKGVFITNDDKFFAILKKLGNIFSKKGEGWICYYNVGLF